MYVRPKHAEFSPNRNKYVTPALPSATIRTSYRHTAFRLGGKGGVPRKSDNMLTTSSRPKFKKGGGVEGGLKGFFAEMGYHREGGGGTEWWRTPMCGQGKFEPSPARKGMPPDFWKNAPALSGSPNQKSKIKTSVAAHAATDERAIATGLFFLSLLRLHRLRLPLRTDPPLQVAKWPEINK